MALFLLLGSGVPARAGAQATAVHLDVPFVAQTVDLCGGAAAAMLFRYWGDTHASARQFEPLVDHRAGGIADTALVGEGAAAQEWIGIAQAFAGDPGGGRAPGQFAS